MTNKIYLYAGYYELYITDKPMDRPYTLLSWHKSVDNAVKEAERIDDTYFFQDDLLPEDLQFFREMKNARVEEIQGRNFLIV